jgi:hypothetical protein
MISEDPALRDLMEEMWLASLGSQERENEGMQQSVSLVSCRTCVPDLA